MCVGVYSTGEAKRVSAAGAAAPAGSAHSGQNFAPGGRRVPQRAQAAAASGAAHSTQNFAAGLLLEQTWLLVFGAVFLAEELYETGVLVLVLRMADDATSGAR